MRSPTDTGVRTGSSRVRIGHPPRLGDALYSGIERVQFGECSDHGFEHPVPVCRRQLVRQGPADSNAGAKFQQLEGHADDRRVDTDVQQGWRQGEMRGECGEDFRFAHHV